MLRVTIPLLYRCPAVGGKLLRRKQAVLQVHADEKGAVLACQLLADPHGDMGVNSHVILGQPHVETVEGLDAEGKDARGIRKKQSFKLSWAL